MPEEPGMAGRLLLDHALRYGAQMSRARVRHCCVWSATSSTRIGRRCTGTTPIVVFSHIPLFAMYPAWGWGTDDAAQALSYVRRFSSVTCLNGHVHQLFTKTEGNVIFYSATTTAYPFPHPGQDQARSRSPCLPGSSALRWASATSPISLASTPWPCGTCD